MATTSCEESTSAQSVHTGSAAVSGSTRIPSLVRGITSFPTLLAAVVVAQIFWACRNRIADPDIHWHMLNAKYIVSTHSFPNVDTRCFTTAGIPWIDHAWLSEIVFYGSYSAFGLLGLYLVSAACVAATMVIVYRMCLSEDSDPFAAVTATMTGTYLAMIGFGARTHIFGWLCFTAMFAILLQFRTGRHAPLWALPLIFCVWINFHASWIFGLVTFAIFLLIGLVRHDIGQLAADPWSKAELKKLMIAGALSVCALFVNPYGYRLLLVPINFLRYTGLSIQYIDEFASADFNGPRGKILAGVLCAVFVLAFTARERWRIVDALLVMFVLYYGLVHIRFLFLVGIVLPPILAPKFDGISSYDGVHERRVLNGLLLVITAVVLVAGIPSRKMLDSVGGEYFPVRAVNYLKTHPPAAHIFHVSSWGGYMEWNLPETQMFIDGRLIDARGVVKNYLDITSLNSAPEQLLESYQISDVLFESHSALARYLSKLPEWERVYVDEQAVIYRRIRVEAKIDKDASSSSGLVNQGQ